MALDECPTALAPQMREADPSLERLAEACRYWLQRCPSLAVQAIQWMSLKHPIHPVQVALLEAVESGRGQRVTRSVGALWVLWVRGIRCAGYACYLGVLLWWLRWRLRGARRALAQRQFHLILKTWALGDSRLPNGEDFYYGNLQDRLWKRGISTLMLCGDANGISLRPRDWVAFARAHTALGTSPRLPEWCLLPPSAPIRLAGTLARAALGLWWRALREADPFLARVGAQAARDCLVKQTMDNGLMWWVGHEAVRQWQPRAVVTLYEANAWERCAWQGVKAASASCRVVGYQHALPFRDSLSLRCPVAGPGREMPLDVVLCVGDVSLELLKDGHERHGVRLVAFGGFHAPAAAREPVDPRRRTVLVTPEGMEAEARLLFAFAAACAQRLPAYRFIFRMFPGMRVSAATIATIEGYARAHTNVQLSRHADIEDDYRDSSVLLYRGSSTALYATLFGLLPVYVHPPSPEAPPLGGEEGEARVLLRSRAEKATAKQNTVASERFRPTGVRKGTTGLPVGLHMDASRDRDSLYLMSGWRQRCATSEAFAALMEEEERRPADQREAEWRAAVGYLSRCVTPVDSASVDALLEVAR